MKRTLIINFVILSIVCVFCVLNAHVALANSGSTPVSAPAQPTGVWGRLISPVSETIGNAIRTLIQMVALGILAFFGWLLDMAGQALNLSISYLVVGMGWMIRNQGFGNAIDTLWKVFRDLVNVMFIFTLVYIGISTILKSDMHKLKHGLANVIVLALLINFSLFFAKAIIDVSAIISDAIYQKMLTASNTGQTTTYGISGAFQQKLGVTQLLVGGENATQQAMLRNALNETGLGFTILYTIGASLLMFQLTIAFLSGALLLIVRFATLVALMIASPIAFVPHDIPRLGHYGKQWWDTFLNQAFLAPVYLLGLYVVLLVVQSARFGEMGADGLNVLFVSAQGNASFATSSVPIVLFFMVAVAMIIGTTSMAKSMSREGSTIVQDYTRKAGSWIGKNIGGRAIGTAAWAGRNTVGRYATRAKWTSNSIDAASNLRARGGLHAVAGYALDKTVNKGIKTARSSTYDARNVGWVQKGTKEAGLELGKASKLNFGTQIEEATKAKVAFAASLNVDSDKVKKKKEGVKEAEGRVEAAKKALKAAKISKDKNRIEDAKRDLEGEQEALNDARHHLAEEQTRNQKIYEERIKKSIWYSKATRETFAKAIEKEREHRAHLTEEGKEYRAPTISKKKEEGSDSKGHDDNKGHGAAHNDNHAHGDGAHGKKEGGHGDASHGHGHGS